MKLSRLPRLPVPVVTSARKSINFRDWVHERKKGGGDENVQAARKVRRWECGGAASGEYRASRTASKGGNSEREGKVTKALQVKWKGSRWRKETIEMGLAVKRGRRSIPIINYPCVKNRENQIELTSIKGCSGKDGTYGDLSSCSRKSARTC